MDSGYPSLLDDSESHSSRGENLVGVDKRSDPPSISSSSLQNSTEITTGSTDHVFLQIGDRQFLTARKTLAHAEGFFGRLLAERWATSKDNIKLHTTPHGIHCEYHFIDRDGDVFSHILGYLRSGMFPVFYDVENGHDHLLYAKLLKEAMYYCMDSLVLWVKEKKYEKAVRVRWVMTHEGPATQFDTKSTETIQLKPTSTTLQRYICPRGLHYGNRSGCGRQCRNAQGDEPIRYREELVHETVCYRREVIFDHDVMNANTVGDCEDERLTLDACMLNQEQSDM